MAGNSIEVSTTINNTPEAVLAYIADVRNRPYYLAPLRRVEEVHDAGGYAAGTTWKWTWLTLGMEFVGTGECLQYEPGKVYQFRTAGGIASTWTYTVAGEGEGTRLHVKVEYDVPESARSLLPAETVRENMKKTESERAVQNLKAILDR